MNSNSHKRLGNALIVLVAFTIPLALGVSWHIVSKHAKETERAAVVAQMQRDAEAHARAEKEAKKLRIDAKNAARDRAAREAAEAEARVVKEREENRDRLRRRYLAAPDVGPTASVRPVALIAFLNGKAALSFGSEISQLLTARKIYANPTIFTATFANEFVAASHRSIDFRPEDFVDGLLIIDARIEDGEIQEPSRMNSALLNLEFRWQDFDQHLSQLLWRTQAKGVGFSVNDARNMALERAFVAFDEREIDLPSTLHGTALGSK